jgi:hypothetical protein
MVKQAMKLADLERYAFLFKLYVTSELAKFSYNDNILKYLGQLRDEWNIIFACPVLLKYLKNDKS